MKMNLPEIFCFIQLFKNMYIKIIKKREKQVMYISLKIEYILIK